MIKKKNLIRLYKSNVASVLVAPVGVHCNLLTDVSRKRNQVPKCNRVKANQPIYANADLTRGKQV